MGDSTVLKKNMGQTNFHRKCMNAKQVLRQTNFVMIFADFWDDYRFQKVCENVAGYASSPQVNFNA